ncbi:flagellar hook-associated protein FlgL [Sphingomonas sp. ID0503]|uniref:flagellar hook-associated protein FlgL n=1 Tax=Sphingomonas sp. ID0503 TaxID=3399691 RepID=UPI003AFB6948
MQIGTSQLFNNSYSRMSTLNAQAAKLQTEIATSKKSNAPSDDAVAFGRLTRITRTISNEGQYADNMKLASSLLQQTDDALGAISTQVQRVRELSLRAASDTLSESDRTSIQTELNGIVDAMMSIANTTDSRGIPLFGGADGQTPFVKDADGNIVYQGQGEPAAIPISDVASIQAVSSGARAFGAIPDGSTNGGTTDLFALVKTLAAALDPTVSVADRKAATEKSLTALAAADNAVTNQRASVGARGARLELESEQLASLAETREIERSSLEDADTTESVVKLQQIMTILQATQASFSKLSQLSLFNYLS